MIPAPRPISDRAGRIVRALGTELSCFEIHPPGIGTLGGRVMPDMISGGCEPVVDGRLSLRGRRRCRHRRHRDRLHQEFEEDRRHHLRDAGDGEALIPIFPQLVAMRVTSLMAAARKSGPVAARIDCPKRAAVRCRHLAQTITGGAKRASAFGTAITASVSHRQASVFGGFRRHSRQFTLAHGRLAFRAVL